MESVKMDNQFSGQPMEGAAYAGVSIVSMVVGWVSLHNVHEIAQLIASIVSIGAGSMAIRHYLLQNKKQKNGADNGISK